MHPSEFKRIRKSVLKLSQSELGDKLDLSNDSISRFETGKYPIDKRTEFALLWLQHLGGSLEAPVKHSEQQSEILESCSVDLLVCPPRHSDDEKRERFGSSPDSSKRAKARANRKKKKKKR
ncbi:helix-turn-helix transcriptional regulator [Vibrio parahaemolyticus]|nr:helix-turn-helix transcriptional regulator [Vibrio parahaemolyticus]MDF4647381.1 helix-turn-helix transcriptional regulator [Vibrio parahaemolyticus]MDF4662495.1 helix-turn-helix transcriptional regulator [Vibrio parahaemolyticus]MDF4677525.1 helix-turn-helix transcriptional regulator [Vibrio parahaemolyticus]MDF4720736.1 helix-turn-helix transcriptional regulator [Vibrio parahaemolyticus]